MLSKIFGWISLAIALLAIGFIITAMVNLDDFERGMQVSQVFLLTVLCGLGFAGILLGSKK